MGIGVSIFLLAAGAILSFAVETDAAEGVDLDTVGIILMLIGGLGLLFSLLVFNDWAPWRDRRQYVGRRDYADDEAVTPGASSTSTSPSPARPMSRASR